VSPLRTLFLPESNVYSHPFDFSARSRDVSYAVSYSCSLFVVPKKVNSFAINKIQTLFAKCRGVGWGIPNATTGHPGWGLSPVPSDSWTLGGTRRRLSAPGRFVLGKPIHPFYRRVSLAILSTFRINTSKSVSKQMTLSPFRINTCEKTGEGGAPS
jgi:hypothetical protein